MRATGMPDWMVAMAALQPASTDGKRTDAAGDRLRNAVELQRQLGDDAERALRADEQPRQVVAGGGFLRAPRRRDHLAVRQHDLQRQHVVLHGAVAHRIGARARASPPCRRARRRRPGSIGKNRPWSRRYSLSCLRVTPGSTTQSRSSAWTARTRFMSRKSSETPPCGALTWPSSEVPVPNGMTGTRCARADAHDLLHVLGRLRKHHRVRRLVLDPGEGVAVLLAHRLRGHEPVAEPWRRAPRSRPRSPSGCAPRAASSATAMSLSCPGPSTRR